MKKTLILLTLIFAYVGITYACTFDRSSFCYELEFSNEDVVLTGEVVAIDSLGIDFKVIEVLRGEETRSIVRIWNGTDFECNGNFSLAASNIGDLQDTVIIILPRITEKENDWEVIDDYRRPDPYHSTPQLKVEKGYVKGFIQGSSIAPIEYATLVLGLEEFREKILENGDCASIVISTKELETKSSLGFSNPFTDQLNIELPARIGEASLRVYAISGELVFREEVRAQNSIAIAAYDWPSGLYVLEWRTKNQLPQIIKVLKL